MTERTRDRRRPRAWLAVLGRAGLGAGLVIALPLTAAADTIYSYTDADGVVHFTSKPGAAPNAKLYMKSEPKHPAPGAVRPGVVPFAPQDRDVNRYSRYDEHIRQAATLYQIPEQLVRAVIKVESDYDARAVSYAGARGLMQLMPETAERLGVKDINDPRENIFGGVRYLRLLANMFNGDLDFTVAGYNAGENAVIQHKGIPPYAQTRDYVVKVTKFYRRYRTIADVVEASLAPPEPLVPVRPIVVNAP
ncbi:MAG: lytic transglycosylase domain-containing protein [Labilithrix sp.]|nr:lytic transglycosylase domain-containing protein [Labilithrix sp.]